MGKGTGKKEREKDKKKEKGRGKGEGERKRGKGKSKGERKREQGKKKGKGKWKWGKGMGKGKGKKEKGKGKLNWEKGKEKREKERGKGKWKWKRGSGKGRGKEKGKGKEKRGKGKGREREMEKGKGKMEREKGGGREKGRAAMLGEKVISQSCQNVLLQGHPSAGMSYSVRGIHVPPPHQASLLPFGCPQPTGMLPAPPAPQAPYPDVSLQGRGSPWASLHRPSLQASLRHRMTKGSSQERGAALLRDSVCSCRGRRGVSWEGSGAVGIPQTTLLPRGVSPRLCSVPPCSPGVGLGRGGGQCWVPRGWV